MPQLTSLPLLLAFCIYFHSRSITDHLWWCLAPLRDPGVFLIVFGIQLQLTFRALHGVAPTSSVLTLTKQHPSHNPISSTPLRLPYFGSLCSVFCLQWPSPISALKAYPFFKAQYKCCLLWSLPQTHQMKLIPFTSPIPYNCTSIKEFAQETKHMSSLPTTS